MSQHDFNIANQGFPATRADLNNALQALASNSSGDAEPSTTFANQWWYETDTNTLKLRNEANNAWLSFATVDQTTGDWTLAHDVTLTGSVNVTGAEAFIANSSSSGDYVRMYASSGTGKWDIYGNGANLRIGDNESLGGVMIDTKAAFGTSPSAWNAGIFPGAIQFGGQGVLAGTTASAQFGLNWYYSDAYRYIGTGQASRIYHDAGALIFESAPSGTAGNSVTWAEKFRVGPTGNISTVGEWAYMQTNSTSASSMTFRKQTNAGADAIDYLQCRAIDNSAKLLIAGSGNVTNVNNSYGAISDVKLKENIQDASSQWDDIKSVQVRKYSFISDASDTPNQIGVIAQELEASGMTGLVIDKQDEIFDERETIIDEDGQEITNPTFGHHVSFADTVTKEVKYSVLYMKAIKALQEAMNRIETLEANQSAMEIRLAALE
jgi:hypothetical protein